MESQHLHYRRHPRINAHKHALSPCVSVTRNREEVAQLAKRNTKQTSRAVARKASEALRDGRSSALTKTLAGSALSQARPSKHK